MGAGETKGKYASELPAGDGISPKRESFHVVAGLNLLNTVQQAMGAAVRVADLREKSSARLLGGSYSGMKL